MKLTPKAQVFKAELDAKVALAKANGLMDFPFIVVTNGDGENHFSIDTSVQPSVDGLVSSMKPRCVNHADFEKVIATLPIYFSKFPDELEDGDAQWFDIDGVQGKSQEDFIFPNGVHSID